MKAKIILLILVVLQAFCFSSCIKEKKKPKIGFSLHGFTHDRWSKDKEYIEKVADDVGVEVLFNQADNDVQKQFDQIEEMLNMGAEAILVVPVNSDKMENIVNLAHSYQVPIIAYDRMANNCKIDYYVSFDNIKVGELQAEYLVKIKPSGKYAMLGGSQTDQNAIFFRLGQINIISPLKEKGDIELVYDDFTPEWDSNEAYIITKRIIKENSDIDVIIATNDDLAGGAIRALQEANLLDQVLVSGMDADLVACQRVAKRIQTMSVYKPLKSLAKTALEIAKELAVERSVSNPLTTINNGSNLVPATLLKNMVVLNADNLDATIIADKFHTAEEVYN